MIELPEAYVLSNQINNTLIGKKIRNAVANDTPHKFAFYTGDPKNYNNLLSGKTITGARQEGYHVYLAADDMMLAISTSILYQDKKEKVPKKHQLLLEFEDGSAISCTVQMWGVFYCFKSGEEDSYNYYIKKGKPSPLCEEFNKEYFQSLLRNNPNNLSAKAFLATEQRIPGIGNGVLQDILWTCKINPRCKLKDLSKENLDSMFNAVKAILKDMTCKGGRDTERDLFGQHGQYKTILSKNTVGKTCPSCGDIILKEAYLGGSIYYCPTCQPKK